MNDFKVVPRYLVVAIFVAIFYHFLFSISLREDTHSLVVFIHANLKTPLWIMILSIGVMWSNPNLRAGFMIWGSIGVFIGVISGTFLSTPAVMVLMILLGFIFIGFFGIALTIIPKD